MTNLTARLLARHRDFKVWLQEKGINWLDLKDDEYLKLWHQFTKEK